jgi:hypothetical protein
MKGFLEEETLTCEVCGRELWYDHTMKDGNEQWVCPRRWIGPDLLKRKPKDPEGKTHTATVRPPQQKDLVSLTNSPGSLHVREYLERAIPAAFKPK